MTLPPATAKTTPVPKPILKYYQYWKNLPESWQKEILSIWHTFVAAFIMAVGAQLIQGDVNISKELLFAALSGGLRSGVKAVMVWIYSQVKVQ